MQILGNKWWIFWLTAVVSTGTVAITQGFDEASAVRGFLEDHCVDCHSRDSAEGDVILEGVHLDERLDESEAWERVVKKLRARQMPPSDYPRPSDAEYERVLDRIIEVLDAHAAAHPDPGRIETMRRLTRTEYRNAVRDLLALEIDVDVLLPEDPSSHGFDNITVGELSPTLMNRYVLAAQKISRLAVGGVGRGPGGDTIRIRPDLTQEHRADGLPLGTRGGALIPYTFPRSGEYRIEVRLARDRNEHVEGLHREHELQVLLDRELVDTFTVRPPRDGNHSAVDTHLKTTLNIGAGPHELGITFVKESSSLMETMRQPLEAKFNVHRHPRQTPALYQVSITGPLAERQEDERSGDTDTPSRRRIFTHWPNTEEEAAECAEKILGQLARRAFRRPLHARDLETPMRFFYESINSGGSFEQGIEQALSSILVSPHFLFRVEMDPEHVAPGEVYQIGDVELASRLSFFLWSSIPDEELLELAEGGVLRQPQVLEEQVRRMLQDYRASNLTTNFAAQWLYLRNLESITPDARRFPDFDDNLRQALRTETEMLFEEVLREDSSVLDLIRADHTYLNERLAKHYRIPHVYGTQFRRVSLPAGSHRGGLLRHGSILTVTSYATRTSPVVRGHWILKNLLGSPPPPPPPDVPTLEENTVAADLPMRERLAAHRDNEACAGCHQWIDSVGFSLENFDAVGRWRELDLGQPVDASGGLPDGSEFVGVGGLESALLARPELFVSTFTEKLMTFALGRGVEHRDGPAVRRIERDAQADQYRFSSIILGIVTSKPFQMRRAQ